MAYEVDRSGVSRAIGHSLNKWNTLSGCGQYMNSSELVDLVFIEYLEYILSLLIGLFVYFSVYKKYFISIFDPLTIAGVFSMFGFVIVIFLKFTGNISNYYFMVYLVTQFAFFFGFRLVPPVSVNKLKSGNFKYVSNYEIQFAFIFFVLSSLTYFVLQVLVFSKGIPIFAESRLNVTSGDFSIKVIQRILAIIYPMVLMLTFYFMFFARGWRKKYARMISLIVFVNAVLLGSKSALLSLVSIFFVFALFSLKSDGIQPMEILSKHTKKIFAASLIVAVAVVLLSGDSNYAFYFIAYRLLSSGDIYFMTYPNGVIENFVSNKDWYISLFSSPLSMLGLVDKDTMSVPLGFDVMRYHAGWEIFKGPNARHNVLGYVYIGFPGAILLSFIFGFVSSYVRNKAILKIGSGPISLALYGALLSTCLDFETDFFLAMAGLYNLVVLAIVVGLFHSFLIAGRK